MKVDRDSIEEAKMVFEKLIPEKSSRKGISKFLWNAIEYANRLDSENWNLNMDKNGKFIRFNTGHPYCIEITRKRLLILCDRATLKPTLASTDIPITFLGHNIDEKVFSEKIDKVPNCIEKASPNVGCLLEISSAPQYLHHFTESNQNFIHSAIKKSKQITQMRDAHSPGAVEYLLNQFGESSKDSVSIRQTFKEYEQEEKEKLEKALKLSSQKRKELLKNADPKPKESTVTTTVFKRNEYVKAEVLERANGICEKCMKPAPFNRNGDAKPYLEVHHKLQLAAGGDDTVENAIALCPNCHRHAHYGTNTY